MSNLSSGFITSTTTFSFPCFFLPLVGLFDLDLAAGFGFGDLDAEATFFFESLDLIDFGLLAVFLALGFLAESTDLFVAFLSLDFPLAFLSADFAAGFAGGFLSFDTVLLAFGLTAFFSFETDFSDFFI